MEKTALLLGASGLVGNHLLQQLLESPHYGQVVAFGRRPLELQHPKLRQEILDFDNPDTSKIKGDDLYCALGTTLAKAGSKEAQYRIDCTYPYEIGKIARQNGVRQYLLVSSLGANARQSANFYLRTKGQLEDKIRELGFEHFVAARPSVLLGERQEFRLGERIGIALTKVFKPLVPRRYRGIEAEKVARALIAKANDGGAGMEILESEEIQEF